MPSAVDALIMNASTKRYFVFFSMRLESIASCLTRLYVDCRAGVSVISLIVR
jgi:hypothetical protein